MSQDILCRMAVRVMGVVSVVFPVFLSSSTLRNNIDGPLEGITTKASRKTCPLLLSVFKDENKLISFIALLFMNFVLILSDVPGISLHFKETCCFLIMRFTVGFILPLIVIDMIDSSHAVENGGKVVVI